MILFKENVERVIKTFTETAGIDIPIKWGVGKDSIGFRTMAYRRKDKTILYNIRRIEFAYEKYYFDKFTIEEFILLSFIHEYGHHLHWEHEERELTEIRNGPENKWRLIFEKGAWEYGKKIVPKVLSKKFDLLNTVNMSNYLRRTS